jgi:hypothetical protein
MHCATGKHYAHSGWAKQSQIYVTPAARHMDLGDWPSSNCCVASRATAAACRPLLLLLPAPAVALGVVGRDVCLLLGDPKGDCTYWSRDRAASREVGELSKCWLPRPAPVADPGPSEPALGCAAKLPAWASCCWGV